MRAGPPLCLGDAETKFKNLIKRKGAPTSAEEKHIKSEERPNVMELGACTHRQRLYVMYLYFKRQVPIVAFFLFGLWLREKERNPIVHIWKSHKI